MKKRVISSLLVGAFVMLGATSAAAEDLKFGAGIAATGNTSELRGTIQFASDMRVEPYFSYNYSDPDNNDATSSVEIGASFHMMQPMNSKVRTYFGAFTGLSSADSGTTTTTVVALGPVAGAEYFLDKEFTLGAEASFCVAVGDETKIGTSGRVLLRYYFNF